MQFQNKEKALSLQPPLPKPWRLQTRANLLASEEAQKLKKAIGSKQKQQGTLGSRKDSSQPSTKPDLSQSQVEKQSTLVPNISSQAANVSITSTFSSNNAAEGE